MGAGLSGLAAATLLARAGREVHVHDIRADSGARFDGDFQALENWSMDVDFFEQLSEWGFDLSSFKATEFSTVDIIHPDDAITQAKRAIEAAPATSLYEGLIIEKQAAGLCFAHKERTEGMAAFVEKRQPQFA